MKDAMMKLLYADDLARVANGKQELEETMEEWNRLFTRHGLKINPQKTEVMHIDHQSEELDIELQARVNAWRAVEGVMADRRISKKLKGKVMSTYVTPAYLYGTETLALTELQQQRLQVCENN